VLDLSRRNMRTCALSLCVFQASCARLSQPSEAGLGGRDVSLRYEGSCAHLACCSSYALPVAAQTEGSFPCADRPELRCSAKPGWFAPAFTCDPEVPHRYRQPGDAPYLACDDRDRWLALPALTHHVCGETFLVCHRGARVLAVARDRSAPNGSGRTHYEASLGLLLALGADPAERETFVSIYSLADRDRIAEDPHCTGDAF
jgi:hypothetical protein